MNELEENKNENLEKEEKMIVEQDDRESDIKLERVTDNIEQKIENADKESDARKVSSLQTIRSIWNTMIGSSIVSIPYNVYYAGIIPTIIIGLLYGFICYFTCNIIVRLAGKEEEFAKVVYNYFNYGLGKKYAKAGRVLQITFNLMINIGATFIYFLIINQNLFPCICFFLKKIFGVDIDDEDITPYFNKFSLFYCALIVGSALLPLTLFKEMSILVKFNSYGIFFVSALLVYVIYTAIYSLAKDTFHFEYKENIKGEKDRNLFLFGENPGMLAGTLSLGLFSHSVILPILKNNKHQENNRRDLFYGYLLVTFTYIIIGILGYIGFSGSRFDSDFKDNWFRFFKSDNIIILILRILNVVQLVSIFPILFCSVRNQFFKTFFEHHLSNKFYITLFSVILLSLCILVLYVCYNTLGKLISIIGASTALVLIYSISPVTNMIYYYIRHQTKEEVQKILDEKKAENGNVSEEEKIFPDNLREPVNLKPVKAFFFYLSMMMVITVGFITLALQFVTINFFNVKIEKN